jgi:hypothetical protein
VLDMQRALLRAAATQNARNANGPQLVHVVVLPEYRTTRQASPHDLRVDLKDKRGLVYSKGGTVRRRRAATRGRGIRSRGVAAAAAAAAALAAARWRRWCRGAGRGRVAAATRCVANLAARRRR